MRPPLSMASEDEGSVWADGWTYISLFLSVALFAVAGWRCARMVRHPSDSEFISVQYR